ncbi:MAG: hypothetical protein GSR73_06320 [Desulfurococcales archaeon]|nr:hypothetical protein [Desulfurococcales archaeon]
MANPVNEAFRKVIQELYWTETLEEAESLLEEYLEMIDSDLREYLLEKRKRICEDPTTVIELVRLNTAAELADSTQTAKVLLTKSLIESGFLFQCTPKWSSLDNKTKARILAPLYRASYGLELALRNWPNDIDEIHLDNAIKMASIALERAEEIGVLDEFREYVDKIVETLEANDETDGSEERPEYLG